MVSLIIWFLILFGFVNGVCSSKLFTPMWGWLSTRNWWVLRTLGDLMSCPMCLGFWAALPVSKYVFSPTFDVLYFGNSSFLNPSLFTCYLCDMFLGSAVCWILYNMCYALNKGDL